MGYPKAKASCFVIIVEIEGGLAMDHSLIVADPTMMMGKPIVAGTRITVELILEKMSSGESIEQIFSKRTPP